MYADNKRTLDTHPSLVARIRTTASHATMVERLANQQDLTAEERRELQAAIEVEWILRVLRGRR